MLWVAIFLPRLASEALSAGTGPQTSPPPLAVCDRRSVLQANEPALALGVHPGIRRATALAIAPGLSLVERDEIREHEALRQLACWALQFTPSVSLQNGLPDPIPPRLAQPAPAPLGLLLEVAPSLRLFGGLPALLERIRQGLVEQGLTARIACAPTPGGAWLLARNRDGDRVDSPTRLHACLAELPVQLLDAARPHLDTLETIGIRTLGQLRALPRPGLARRFGPALLAELDHAFGDRPEPRLWFEAPAVFDARLELLAQVETTGMLLFAAQRLLIQLTGWLGARHSGAASCTLHAEHDDVPATVFEVRLAAASRDPARLLGVLRELLARASLPAPVHSLRLHCDACVPLAPAASTLFPLPASAHEDLARLVERLQARLGREQVQRLRVAGDHRPEAACRFEPLADFPQRSGRSGAVPASGVRFPSPGAGLPRPLWLQERPGALAERNGRPWSNGPLALLAGPERIESGWWDGAPVQRDYFIAADDDGRMLWIFRQRLPDTTGQQGWFVHGRFG